MPAPMEQTIGGAFKGVPFLLVTETQEGGRKVAIQEYPGSDHRFVQDLGKKPGIFRLSCYVSGEDWLQQERRLTTALEDKTEGVLELSAFGTVKVKAQVYSKSVRQTEIGRADFTITFLVSTPNPSPVIAPNTVETVAKAAVNVLEISQENFAENFIVPTLATTAEVAEYDGVQLAETVAETISSLGQDVDTVTGFATTIRNNIARLVRDPIEYASTVFDDGLLGEVFKTIGVSRAALNALSGLCRIGYNLAKDFETIKDDALTNLEQSFDIPVFADDITYRITNNRNRLLITNSVRTSIFVTYLNQASRNDYLTDSEINDVIADINDVYENVILIDGVDPLVALALDQCRIQALQVLDEKIQTTPNVVTLDLKAHTVDIELAYRLYAEEFESSDDLTERTEELTGLNGILSTRYLEGEIEVFRL